MKIGLSEEEIINRRPASRVTDLPWTMADTIRYLPNHQLSVCLIAAMHTPTTRAPTNSPVAAPAGIVKRNKYFEISSWMEGRQDTVR
jgi:hypothetical protein